MQYLISSAVALLLTPLALGKSAGQLCRGTAKEADDGNWYCSEVKAITYRNISQSGFYNRTTQVDPNTGRCVHETVAYDGTGSLTPLFGELSMHLRGPMNVSQIAVYQLPGGMHTQQNLDDGPVLNERNDIHPDDIGTHHVHVGLHTAPARHVQNVTMPRTNGTHLPNTTNCSSTSCPTTVTTTVFVTNSHCETQNPVNVTQSTSKLQTNGSQTLRLPPCPSTFETRVSTAYASSAATMNFIVPTHSQISNSSSPNGQRPSQHYTGTVTASPTPAKMSTSAPTLDVSIAAAAWSRVAYYTSTAPAQATGFAFLANLGDPQKSGTFDYAFGNSLSYVSQDGSKVASESTPFDGTLETSEIEIAAFTDQQCEGDCEYSRPQSTEHHGWDGESKAFFIEFQMDHYDNVDNNQGMLSDAPAWWFLNAAIPRILQYGNDRDDIPCSCWSTGCGEFDAFEVLGRGEERAKSTIHRQGNIEGGDSNYFKRPVGRTIKFAVVFYNYNITVAVLDDNFDFSQSLATTQIDDIIAYDPNSNTHSLFAIGT